MKRIYLITAGILLLLSSRLLAYEDGDFQVWNTEAQEFKVGQKAKIALEEEFRWGGRAKELYYQHYDLGFFYNLQKNFNVGLGYRHVLSKSSKNKFLAENEPYLNATLFWDLAGFKFDDRSRLEYNHFAYKKDTGRYRNKLTVKAPWKFTQLEVQPYLSDEIFVVFDDYQNFNTNRFYAGLGMTINKYLKGEIYYLLQSSKNAGRWTDANVLGTKFKLSF